METKKYVKLWEAILIGCDRRAQGFGRFFVPHDDGTTCSCVIGAAFEGVTGQVGTVGSFSRFIERYFPHLAGCMAPKQRCPVGCSRYEAVDLYTVLVHLNEVHKWPREKIALDYVKPLEEQTEPGLGAITN